MSDLGGENTEASILTALVDTRQPFATPFNVLVGSGLRKDEIFPKGHEFGFYCHRNKSG